MGSFDQIFDRFGNLVRSWTQTSSSSDFIDKKFNSFTSSYSVDTDYNDAMDELDAFLNDDREKQEEIRRRQEAKRQYESQSFTKTQSGPDPKLLAAYKALGLKYGTDFQTVKSTYKKLLKEHHPDKHNGSAEELRIATEKSTRFNNAFRIIETWHETGKIEND